MADPKITRKPDFDPTAPAAGIQFVDNHDGGIVSLVVYREEPGPGVTPSFYCGYVGVLPGHPDFCRDHHSKPIRDLKIHDGVTYGGIGFPTLFASRKDVPPVGMMWWFGFVAWSGASAEWVRAECAKLAAQLRDRGKAKEDAHGRTE